MKASLPHGTRAEFLGRVIPRAALPISGLVLASATGLSLLLAKILWTGHGRDLYLAWNLFLAWLPLLFAGRAWRAWTGRREMRSQFWGMALAWGLFFPNAPYIFTDLVHLPALGGFRYWADLVLILLFALTGTVAGFISLYLMHQIVRRRWGWEAGWIFVAAMAGMSGLGVYVGRFLRWNSWDALLRPWDLVADLTQHFASWPGLKHGPAFLVLFAIFVLTSYLLMYLLLYLPRPWPRGRVPGEFVRLTIERSEEVSPRKDVRPA